MTFSVAQTGAKAGVGERYLPKRVELAAKIETSNEVSPHDFHGLRRGARLVPRVVEGGGKEAGMKGRRGSAA